MYNSDQKVKVNNREDNNAAKEMSTSDFTLELLELCDDAASRTDVV